MLSISFIVNRTLGGVVTYLLYATSTVPGVRACCHKCAFIASHCHQGSGKENIGAYVQAHMWEATLHINSGILRNPTTSTSPIHRACSSPQRLSPINPCHPTNHAAAHVHHQPSTRHNLTSPHFHQQPLTKHPFASAHHHYVLIPHFRSVTFPTLLARSKDIDCDLGVNRCANAALVAQG